MLKLIGSLTTLSQLERPPTKQSGSGEVTLNGFQPLNVLPKIAAIPHGLARDNTGKVWRGLLLETEPMSLLGCHYQRKAFHVSQGSTWLRYMNFLNAKNSPKSNLENINLNRERVFSLYGYSPPFHKEKNWQLSLSSIESGIVCAIQPRDRWPASDSSDGRDCLPLWHGKILRGFPRG